MKRTKSRYDDEAERFMDKLRQLFKEHDAYLYVDADRNMTVELEWNTRVCLYESFEELSPYEIIRTENAN